MSSLMAGASHAILPLFYGDTLRTFRRSHSYAILGAIVVVPAILYIASGILHGFLEADDFGWLTTARDQTWHHIFSFGSYDHFYRPVIRAWFVGAVRICHDSAACYHALNLSVHLINTILFAALSIAMTRDAVFSSLAALVFAISPGDVEAVAWVSAITEVLSTLFLLTAALLVLHATMRRWATAGYAAALAAMLALFAHEASAVLFALIPFLLWRAGRLGEIRTGHVWTFAAVGAIFLTAIIAANHRNVIFTEGHYTVGVHMIRQGLDYLVSMYVGPHRWTGRLFVAIAAATILVFGPQMSRAGIVWVVIALIPFLGFTTGNASRYLYLPTMGFGWVVAGLLLAAHRRLAALASHRVATGVVTVIAAIGIGRFCVFTSKAIASHNESFAVYREYAQMVSDRQLYKPGASEIQVPAPSDANYDRASIQPMLRWVLKEPHLIVKVDDVPAPRRP
jgi:hypothetical protein